MTQQANINSTKILVPVHLNTKSRISVKELYKYTMGLFGIFTLVVVTYPIAIHRVAQQQKFAPYRSHVKSLTADYK